MWQTQHQIKRIFPRRMLLRSVTRGRCAPGATEDPAEGRRYKPVTFPGARVCTDVPGVFEQMRTRRRTVHTHVPGHSRASCKMARAPTPSARVRPRYAARREADGSPHRPLNWRRFPAGYRCSISRLETGERLQTLSRSKLLHVA